MRIVPTRGAGSRCSDCCSGSTSACTAPTPCCSPACSSGSCCAGRGPCGRGAPGSAASPLAIGDPSTVSRWWDYVSLKQLGGGFLVQFFPRNAPFWSVQVADLLRVIGANVLSWTGTMGVLGALPAVAAVGGFVALWNRQRRLALALAGTLFLQLAGT